MTSGMEPARSRADRTRDARARLAAPNGDVWVATASPSGDAYLVPLSYAWDGEHVVIAVQASSTTARNLQVSGQARLGFGPTRDVVLVDATLSRTIAVGDADAAGIGERYAGQADWDPRADAEGYVFLLLRPSRIQAWCEANELADRLLMRDGAWLDG